jgi:hypothetical protein
MLLIWTSIAAATPITFEGNTYFTGDLHVHTGASGDGGSADFGVCDVDADCGAVADLAVMASEAGLDFLAVTDHVNGTNASDDPTFSGALALALEAHDPKGGLVVLPGAEVWYRLRDGTPLGHKNLLLFGTDDEVAGFEAVDAQHSGRGDIVASCETAWSAARAVQKSFGPALLIPHHPSLNVPMITDWTCHDPEVAPAVEIYSEHGASDLPEATWDPPWSGTTEGTSVYSALLDHGHQLGFVGGTDRHDTHPGAVCRLETMLFGPAYGGGLTIAVAPSGASLSREVLYEAITTRRTYATSGPVLPVVVEASTGGALVATMGETAGVPPGQPLDVEVRVPADLSAYVEEVLLVSPLEDRYLTAVPEAPGTWRASVPSDELPPWFWAEVRVDGAAWWVTCDDGGADTQERLWLSPIWLGEGAPDLDGDGVAFLDGDCDDGDPAVSPSAAEDCANSVDDDCDGAADGDDDDCAEPIDTADTETETETEDTETDDTETEDSESEGTDSEPGTGDETAAGTPKSCGCDSRGQGHGLVPLAALVVAATRRAARPRYRARVRPQ